MQKGVGFQRRLHCWQGANLSTLPPTCNHPVDRVLCCTKHHYGIRCGQPPALATVQRLLIPNSRDGRTALAMHKSSPGGPNATSTCHTVGGMMPRTPTCPYKQAHKIPASLTRTNKASLAIVGAFVLHYNSRCSSSSGSTNTQPGSHWTSTFTKTAKRVLRAGPSTTQNPPKKPRPGYSSAHNSWLCSTSSPSSARQPARRSRPPKQLSPAPPIPQHLPTNKRIDNI